jgi:autotransporter family porin
MGVNQHSTLPWCDTHSWSPQRVLSGQPQSARPKGLFLKLATALALVCISGSTALADCAPANPGAGGTVTCSGNDPDGYVAPANTPLTVNVLTNATVQGAGNPGVQISGTGDDTVNNNGVIGSNNGTAVEFDGVAGFTKTLNNNGTLNNNFVGTGDGTIVILQNGNFNGGITITGNGQNLITDTANHNINGPVNISGVASTIDNAGIFNQGLLISGNAVNSITNHAGGQINQTFSITGDATTTIDNAAPSTMASR